MHVHEDIRRVRDELTAAAPINRHEVQLAIPVEVAVAQVPGSTPKSGSRGLLKLKLPRARVQEEPTVELESLLCLGVYPCHLTIRRHKIQVPVIVNIEGGAREQRGVEHHVRVEVVIT